METLNAFDQLLDYPKENKLIYETHLNDQRFYLSPNDPIQNTKYIIFKKQNLIFCAYDSYAAKVGSSQTFTGIYCPIRLKPGMELKLTRKYWSDFLFVINKRKTGIERIDRNFTLSASKDWNFQVLFDESTTHLFQELEKHISPVKLIIQHDYLPMISELKGQQVIGLETNEWIFQKEKVGQFLELGGKIINQIISSSDRFF
jgi:hypothetical protein